MTDIFVSYKREDRKAIDSLIIALNNEGYAVWSDARTRISLAFIQQINESLRDAKCILVVWSERSTTSKWVLSEAYEGFERDCLIPILIDDVRVPVPYSAIQTADFRKWGGDLKAPEWRDLIAAIQSYCGPHATSKHPSSKKHGNALLEVDIDAPLQLPAPANVARTATQDEIEEVRVLIVRTLERAAGPVATARMAHVVRMAFPDLVRPYYWLGHHTFMRFFKSLALDGITIDSRPPGIIHKADYSPQSTQPSNPQVEIDENFRHRLFEITEAPLLTPEQYRSVFNEIAAEIKAGHVGLGDVVRGVKDRLQQKNRKIARAKVSFIVKGALFGGLKLDSKIINADQVGFCFATNLVNLCAASGWEISPNESGQILSIVGLDDDL